MLEGGQPNNDAGSTIMDTICKMDYEIIRVAISST